MVFGFFNKKNDEPKKENLPHYDPSNIKITDIRKGFVLDYDFKTWQVSDEFEYDWGDNFFSYEYKLTCGDDEVYLSIDTDGELVLMMMKKIKMRMIGDNIEDVIIQTGKPPQKIVYEGVTYYRESEAPGFWRNLETMKPHESVEMYVWDYYDETETKVISIEQWGDEEFEAFAGVLCKEWDFTNILPAMRS
jgi:hypothetical protein